MGRGSSGAGGGSSANGGGGAAVAVDLNRAIQNALNGGLDANFQTDILPLADKSFAIDTSVLNNDERQTLSVATMETVLDNGQMAKNSVSTADAIFGGNTVQLNLSQFTTQNLVDIIPILNKTGNSSAVNSALKLLSWANQ